MESTDFFEHSQMAQVMPLAARLMCFMRQQASQTYNSLGYDITPEAADTLMIIQHFDGLAQKKLAYILDKDKASITRLLNNLVKAKLVERVQDRDDRRIIRAHITTEGQKVYLQALPKLKALSNAALGNISNADFKTTVATLTQITDNLQTTCCTKD